MPTINRYIVRLYLTNVVILFAILFSFVVAIDVFINLDRFSKQAEGILGEGAGGFATLVETLRLIVDLWWPRLLQLFNVTSGVVLIAGMGFTCSHLVKHRELVALLASGVSLHRLAAPFLIVATIVTCVQLMNQELIVPRVAHLLTRSPGDAGTDSASAFRVTVTPDAEPTARGSEAARGVRLVTAARYDAATRSMEDVIVYVREPVGSTVIARVVASRAEWESGAGRWRLVDGYVERTPGSVRVTAELAERNPELGPLVGVGGAGVGRGALSSLSTPLDPESIEVRYLQGLAQNLSFLQLGELSGAPGIDPQQASRLERLRWARPASMLSNLLTLVAAMPFFLSRTPGPMIMSVFKSVPVGLLGLAAAAAPLVIDFPGMPTAIGAFLPALILAPLAMALYSSMKS